MKGRIAALLLAAACMTAAGCGSEKNGDSAGVPETVALTLWGAAEDEALLQETIRTFEQEYQGQANFQITFEVQGESDCKDVLLSGLEAGADGFTFSDDPGSALAGGGAPPPAA